MIKIWLDDERPAPDGWTLCKTYEECVGLLPIATHISFDHDLGGDKTGYDVAKYIENLAANGLNHKIGWAIHSANPVGRTNIQLAMLNAERYWDEF